MLSPHDGDTNSSDDIRIEPRAMEILVYLAEHPKEVVSKDQIIQDVWKGAFVSDEALTNCISNLRKSLGRRRQESDLYPDDSQEGLPPVGGSVAHWRFVPPAGEELEKSPYPGLAPFSEDEAEFFFGREEEVKRLRERVGRTAASGVDWTIGRRQDFATTSRTSFGSAAGVASGALSTRRSTLCPSRRALVPELVGDAEATQELLRFDEPDVALSVLERWRKAHTDVLLVVDQFEELFALNTKETQSCFADLLGRAASEAGVRVLISLRDDFLIQCHNHPGLSEVFNELTPLKAPEGEAFRRALVGPAERCGYQFEDDALVDEMLAEVEDARGALPLLSFAASRLWVERDQEKRFLTRKAYRSIGGVGGALAQHAESLMESIGSERLPIVRELFRNLVTAQGTRASRDKEELLSVFEDKNSANDVLRALIGARLLTSFEIEEEEEEKSRHRVEIIHESLLSAWPRLVRWQTQDADSAKLRDELRQAAHIWEQRGRSADRLWTETAVKEFQIWRERYPGQLTAVEDAFASAMIHQLEKRTRRRRLAVVAIVVLLAGGLSVIATLWQRSEWARGEAIQEVERREAAQLLALGRIELDNHPTAALAYTIASLERADSLAARRFAVEALWRGPPAFILYGQDNNTLDFSPDGRWLAVGGVDKGVQLWSQEGGPSLPLVPTQKWPPTLAFGHESKTLFVASELISNSGKRILSVSIPDGEEIRSLRFETDTWFTRRDSTLVTFSDVDENDILIRTRRIGSGENHEIGRLSLQDLNDLDVTARQITYARGGKLFLRSLNEREFPSERLIGTHENEVGVVAFEPGGQWIAAGDDSGRIFFWPITGKRKNPISTFSRFRGSTTPTPSVRNGKWMNSGHGEVLPTSATSWLWDLRGPPDAGPLPLLNSQVWFQAGTKFHPNGRWLAAANPIVGTVLWPMNGKYARVLKGHSGFATVAFHPDGRSLLSVSTDGTVRTWPLSADAGERSRTLLDDGNAYCTSLAIDAAGQHLLINSRHDAPRSSPATRRRAPDA